MLISPVAEDENGKREGRGDSAPVAGHLHEYQTASELFDLMASNHVYRSETGENETLTTRDLVLIYKNIDLGTKLMSDANEFKKKPSNQYVETIVYEDLDSDSDLSEMCSHEDIRNVMMINNERINLLTRSSSFENTICHKFGDIDLCTSDLSVEYDRKYLYTNPYLNNHININTKHVGNTVLPVSLLDYICCKRMEENYNFDMDSIIKYVKQTIDQLKRISNGDYLTEKVKEKWREVDNKVQIEQSEVMDAKVLAHKTSIPLYVERRLTGNTTKWDDLVHSSVDIRSLSKILEKKIIVEVPKSLCGSYTLFSKCCDDNLVIRCQKEKSAIVPKKASSGSHVDVVVHLNRSQSGNVISNINTIMILRKPEPTDLLPLLTYENSEKACSSGEKVIEINKHDDYQVCVNSNADNNNQNLTNVNCSNTDSPSNHPCSSENLSPFDTGDSGYNSSGLPTCMYGNYGDRFKKFGSDLGSPNSYMPSEEFRLTLQKLNMTSLPEESNEGNSSTHYKRRSPTRTRIKSPYENKLHLAEEKKRKRLLEVRQKREKGKLALSVTGCRVKKNKYPIPPQTVNSVTKLSISNKSFYNSIYGQTANVELKPSKMKVRKETSDSIPEVPSDAELNSSTLSPDLRDIHSQKYINKNYYLDNAVTEMMYNKQKSEPEESLSETMSATTNDINMELRLLSHLIVAPSVIKLALPELDNENLCPEDDNAKEEESPSFPSIMERPEPPNNSPLSTEPNASEKELDEGDPKKSNTSSEFIKSIDKIYELIHKLGKTECNETKLFKSKFTAVAERVNYNDVAGASSTVQCSDSGTSVKHQLTSSNPSCFSFEKPQVVQNPTTEGPSKKNMSNMSTANVVPKVIISTKAQNPKAGGEKSKRDYRRFFSANRQNTTQNNADNPLKAISQLLHDFDNLQKSRSKTITERVPKKPEVTFADIKAENRNVVKKASKVENPEQHFEKQTKYMPREKKFRSPVAPQVIQGPRALKKNVVDIVDEMKEARGEAVRGPCKLNARLNSLAQPKKTYVQAQIEEFHARFGRSIITDRLQKMSGTQHLHGQSVDLPKSASSKLRRKKDSPERLSTSKSFLNAHPAVLEKSQKKSPTINKLEIRVPNDQCFKQSNAFARETSKKKIMALSMETPDRPPSYPNSEVSNVGLRKLRAPYVPNDIEIGSMVSSIEESSAIRNNIHQMINVIIPNAIGNLNLSDKSGNFKLIEETETNEKVPDKNPRQKPTNIEYNLCDSQQERPLKMKCEFMIGDTIPETNNPPQDNEKNLVPESESTKALQLHRNIPIGAFQKRINHKPLTLTPKESMQQVLLLQSGDSNSVILQSTISQNIFTNNKEPDLKYQMLTNLDWNFAQFPVQMPIIGYSIPKYLKPRTAQTEILNPDRNSSNTNKTTQCFKGTHVEQGFNHATHVDVKDFLTLTNLMKLGSTVIEEELEETNIVANIEPEKKQELVKNTSTTEISNLDNFVMKNTSTTEISDLDNFVIKNTSTTEISNIDNFGKQIDVYKDVKADIIHNECMDTLSQKCINTLSANNLSSPATSSMDTTSLDVLVGLLNEIQKITSCQSQMARSDAGDTGIQCEGMQAILKSAAVEQEARSIISITSLDKLRKLESNGSILSFYLSNHGDKDIGDNSFANIDITPMYVDKEVSAVMPTAFVNKCTSVPSQFFPLTMNHSTNVSNSLIGILSEPSSHSNLTINDQPLRSNRSLTCLTNLFELQKNIRKDMGDQLPVALTRRHVEVDSYRKVHNKIEKLPNNLDRYKLAKKALNKNYSVHSDFDPVMKMKRDILVTVYSVLVLTVFAALSFPDILYSA